MDMPVLKYLGALWIALMFYAVSSMFAGASGLWAYRELSAEKEKQVDNLMRLEAANAEFTRKRDALVSDGDALAVVARGLGYGSRDERFIRVAGLDYSESVRMNAGSLVLPETPPSVSDTTLRVISLVIVLVLSLYFCTVDIMRFMKSDGRAV